MREGRPNLEEYSKQKLDAARDASFAANQDIDPEELKMKSEIGLEPLPTEDIKLETFSPGEKRYSPGHRGDIFDESTHYPQGKKGGRSNLEIARPGDKKIIDPNDDFRPKGEINSGLELDLPN